MMLPGGTVASPFSGQSLEARAIGELFTETLVICGVILLVVSALVAACIVRFRARPGAAEPAQIHGHTRLEIAWTVVPVLIVLALFILTARTMGATDPPVDRQPDVTIIG